MINTRNRRQFLLFVVDIAILYGTLYLSLFFRNMTIPSPTTWIKHVYVFSFAFIGWAVIFYTASLYSLDNLFNKFRFAARLFTAIALSTLGTTLMFYLWPEQDISPKTVLFLFAVLSFILIWSWRMAYGRVVRSTALDYNVGFIGVTDEVLFLVDVIEKQPYLGYKLDFLYDEEKNPKESGTSKYTSFEELQKIVDKNIPDLFVLSKDSTLAMKTRRLLFSQIGEGARYMRLPDFYETVLRRIPVDAINDSWFLENIDLRAKKPYLVLKEILDPFFAGIVLLATLPLLILITLAVKIESKGPVIFKQVRLGKKNKPFTIYKFRTMRTEGNDYVPTSSNDSRITRMGKFMRASRLDELPQMVNILLGEMSFIGPRPERPELAEQLAQAIPYYMQRHLLKPGITGWDQVSGEYHSPSVADTYKKLQFDLYYIKNTSIFLDISIFFKTIMTMLSRAGL